MSSSGCVVALERAVERRLIEQGREYGEEQELTAAACSRALAASGREEQQDTPCAHTQEPAGPAGEDGEDEDEEPRREDARPRKDARVGRCGEGAREGQRTEARRTVIRGNTSSPSAPLRPVYIYIYIYIRMRMCVQARASEPANVEGNESEQQRERGRDRSRKHVLRTTGPAPLRTRACKARTYAGR